MRQIEDADEPAGFPPGSSPDAFILQLSRDQDNKLQVDAQGPAGAVSSAQDFPDLDVSWPPSIDGADDAWVKARRVGTALHEAVFGPEVVRLLEESRLAVGDGLLPMALELSDPSLAALPWEILRDPETERFIALSEQHALSRRVPPDPSATGANAKSRAGKLGVSFVAPPGSPPGASVSPGLEIARGIETTTVTDLELVGTVETHVLHVTGGVDVDAIPAGIPVVVLQGGVDAAARVIGRVGAIVAIPSDMPAEAQKSFLSTLYTQLAAEDRLDQSVAHARRAVAKETGVVNLIWALPVLLTNGPAGPILPSTRLHQVAGLVSGKVKERTVDWAHTTLEGVASSVVLFLLGLILFRLGFSESPEFSIELLSPLSLYQSFKGLVVELSTFQEYILLIAAVMLAIIAATVTALWLRRRESDSDEARDWRDRLLQQVASARAVSFFLVASLTVLGAFIYQEYLWHVLLPIPGRDLGIAITRQAAASSFSGQLADSLFSKGESQQVVIRELPVAFDASDTAKARALGRRIAAKAVLIYRADQHGSDGKPQYVAYLVFTDPTVGLSIGSPPTNSELAGVAGPSQPVVQIKEGVEVPALRTETLSELVSASAGIIAYQEDRFRDAIAELQLALPKDPNAPNTGVVNFYLGNALDMDSLSDAAAAAYERAAAYLERQQAEGQTLGPQDELILVETYTNRGQLAAFNDDWNGAISWYEKANALQADLLARASGLERPSDVHAAYSRLFTQLADAYRGESKSEEEQYWRKRASDELNALADQSDPKDAQTDIHLAASQFFLGSCVDAAASLEKALTIDPKNTDALNDAEVVAVSQGRLDIAQDRLQHIIAIRPDDIRARQQLANLLWDRGLGDDYVDLSYLQAAEAEYHDIVTLDPSNLNAHQELADLASFAASGETMDLTAARTGDDFTLSKSQSLWPADPNRRQAALDALKTAIEERRILATELEPNDVGAQVQLVQAYGQRLSLLYSSLYAVEQSGDKTQMQSLGPQVLADVSEVRDWTGKVTAPGSGATRTEQLQATAELVSAIDKEWGWYQFYAYGMLGQSDAQAKATSLAQEYQQTSTSAVALVESSPIANPDEETAAAQIYNTASFAALALDQDQAKASTYQQKASQSETQALTSWQKSTGHLTTFCREEQERTTADGLVAKGDVANAKAHYQAALAANPNHVPSLTGLAHALYLSGDSAGAVDQARKASQITPNDPAVWSSLVLYQLATGDTSGSSQSYHRFFDTAGALPSQQRLALVHTAIADLQITGQAKPQLTPAIRQLVPVFSGGLQNLASAADNSYEYALRVAELGKLALYSDDPATAEQLYRRAIQLDPHQPIARTDLALAVIAQGRDATSEIAAAIAETRDPLWANSTTYTSQALLQGMQQEEQKYVKQFPARQAGVAALDQAIAGETQKVKASQP